MKTIEKIKDNFEFYFLEIKAIYRSILIGIKNTFLWLPVIWNDRQWDSYYLSKIIRHKLTLMINSRIEDKNLMVCKEILDRIVSDYYYEEISEFYSSDVWFEEVGNTFEFREDNIVDNLDIYFNRNKLLYKKVRNKYKKITSRYTIASIIAEEKKEKAIKLVFKMMSNYHNDWWY